MKELTAQTVADIVTENIKTANVFKKYGIDFCCGGGVSIDKVCQEKKIDPKLLEQELLAVTQEKNRDHDYNSWKLDFLINYIINVHHSYVVKAVPQILQYSNKVAEVHGDLHPEVIKINDLFHHVANELRAHMSKEEELLFPYIIELVKARSNKESAQPPSFGTVRNPIQMMITEHENVGESLRIFDKLSNNYTPPESACNTYRALYANLSEFEQDLHLHIHLENNILFPKAVKLEQDLLSQ